VPTGTQGGTITAYTYNNFDGTGGTTNALFPALLGAADHAAGSRSGFMNASYTVIDEINEKVLANIGNNVDDFSNQTGTIGTTIDNVVSSVNGTLDTITSFNTMIGSFNDSVSSIMKIVTIGVTAFFGVFIGLGVLAIIGTILMTCCDKYSCRYLIYFTCVILFVLGLICFFLSVIFSILTPTIYFACDFLSTTISSPANFTTNIQPLLGASLTGYVSVCLPGGTGDITSQAGADVSSINGLSDALDQMRQLNTTTIQSSLLTALNYVSDEIDAYYYSDKFDYSSSINDNFIRKVSDRSTAAYSTCTTNGFDTDSWIPSTRQSTFSCIVSAGSLVSTTQCGTQAQITGGKNGVSPNNVCFGCLDSTKILVNDPSTTPLADLTTRYGSPGAGTPCKLWLDDMTLLYNNYYAIKKTKYGPVQTRMAGVITSYNTATTGYKARVGVVGSKISTIITNL